MQKCRNLVAKDISNHRTDCCPAKLRKDDSMIDNTAVIGAGIMGRGIALIYALNGYQVSLYDSIPQALDAARSLIEADLELLSTEGLVTPVQRQHALAGITFTDSLSAAVSAAAFITEAVPEQLELKWQVFAEIESIARTDAIIASNTSTIPLADLVKHLRRPERMIITHFFNPAHLVPLVEIIKGDNVPPRVVAMTLDLMKKLGKTPVVLKKEVPGFIANRLQAALLREALYLVDSGVATVADIDTAVTAGPGFRWSIIGPLETADFGGLDTWQKVMNNLCAELDSSQSAPDVIDELNQQGHLGVKSGAGFYHYPTQAAVADKIRARDLDFIRLLKLRRLRS